MDADKQVILEDYLKLLPAVLERYAHAVGGPVEGPLEAVAKQEREHGFLRELVVESAWGHEAVIPEIVADIRKAARGEPLGEPDDEPEAAHVCRRAERDRLAGERLEYAGDDALYTQVLSEYAACEADELPQVKSFRREVLSDTLSEQEAHAFVRSPAARYLSREQFQAWSIPVIGHTVVEDTGADGSISLTFQPSGATYVIRRSACSVTIDGYREVAEEDRPEFPARVWRHESDEDAVLAAAIVTEAECPEALAKLTDGRPQTAERAATIRGLMQRGELLRPTVRRVQLPFERALFYPTGRGVASTVKVWPGSVLDELRDLGEGLADRFQWRPGDATWFVLTGEPPTVVALAARSTTGVGEDSSAAQLDLKLSPWLSCDTVARAYRTLRLRLGLGKRRPTAETLEVVRFVIRQVGVDIGGKDPRWKTLLPQWNASYPERQFRRPGVLAQYYLRARRALRTTRGAALGMPER